MEGLITDCTRQLIGCCTLTEIVLTWPDAQCIYPRVKALNVFLPVALASL